MNVGDKVRLNVGYLVSVDWDGIKQKYIDRIREDVLRTYTVKEVIPKRYMTCVVLDDAVLSTTTFFTWEVILEEGVD